MATAAIGGAVGGGLVGYEGGPPVVAGSPEDQMVNAAINGTVSQGANIAFGLQKGFNWEAVAAATVAAPIAQDVGAEVGTSLSSDLNATADKIVSSLASASVDEGTYALATGGKINYAQIVADGFGNVIGDSIVQAQVPQYGLTPTQQQQEASDISASTSAALKQVSDQINDQVVTAAGGSANTGDAPLTNNEEPTLPEVGVRRW